MGYVHIVHSADYSVIGSCSFELLLTDWPRQMALKAHFVVLTISRFVMLRCPQRLQQKPVISSLISGPVSQAQLETVTQDITVNDKIRRHTDFYTIQRHSKKCWKEMCWKLQELGIKRYHENNELFCVLCF